jgi:hypothetical protein
MLGQRYGILSYDRPVSRLALFAAGHKERVMDRIWEPLGGGVNFLLNGVTLDCESVNKV